MIKGKQNFDWKAFTAVEDNPRNSDCKPCKDTASCCRAAWRFSVPDLWGSFRLQVLLWLKKLVELSSWKWGCISANFIQTFKSNLWKQCAGQVGGTWLGNQTVLWMTRAAKLTSNLVPFFQKCSFAYHAVLACETTCNSFTLLNCVLYGWCWLRSKPFLVAWGLMQHVLINVNFRKHWRSKSPQNSGANIQNPTTCSLNCASASFALTLFSHWFPSAAVS